MQIPEAFFHLDHLPPIDRYYIDQGHNAVYRFPSVDYPNGKPFVKRYEDKDKNIIKESVVENIVATPAAVQYGLATDRYRRHENISRTIPGACDLHKSRFGQDVQNALGEVMSTYFYNPPWSYYDWHRDLTRHECAINFVLTDAPGARTMFRHPTDCALNYHVQLLEYKLYRPVLIHAKTEHCVANLTDQHRYIITMVLLEAKYEQAKEWLLNYNCFGYL